MAKPSLRRFRLGSLRSRQHRGGLAAREADRAAVFERLEPRVLLSAVALDPTFGEGGHATADLPKLLNDRAVETLVQGNGVVLVGETTNVQSRRVLTMVRYHSDGTLDDSFGVGGKVLTDFGTNSWNVGGAVIDSDGGIIAAGSVSNPNASDLFLVRWDANGALDPNFGAQGLMQVDFGYANMYGEAVTLDGDGNIVVTGHLNALGSATQAAYVARFLPTGAPDEGFDGDGLMVINSTASAYASELAIDADGGIVVAGSVSKGLGKSLTLWRVTSAGAVDTNFGTAGQVAIDVATLEASFGGVSIDSEGRIVAAARLSHTFPDQTWVMRYSTDGDLDETFGGDGIVEYVGGMANDMGIDAAGRIVVAVSRGITLLRLDDAGQFDPTFGTDGVISDLLGSIPSIAFDSNGGLFAGATLNGDYLVARYNEFNALDVNFDGDGFARTGFIYSFDEHAVQTLVLPDGKLLVAGHIGEGFSRDLVLARFNANGTLDTTFGGGDGWLSINLLNSDAMGGLALDSLGRIVIAATSNVGFNSGRAYVLRLMPNGQFDTTFNGSGKFALSSSTAAHAVQVDSQDRIVIAGESFFSSIPSVYMLARVLPTGVIDTTFKPQGPGSIAGPAPFTDIELLPDDSILAVSYDRISNSVSFSVRYFKSDGSNIFSGFGETGAGYTSIDFAGLNDLAFAVSRDSAGRILVAGYATAADGTRQMGVARLAPDGKIDRAFGIDGRVMIPVGASAEAHDIVPMPGGTILITGQTTSAAGATDSVIVRLLGDGKVDTTFGDAGVMVIDLGGDDAIAAALLDSDQKLLVTGQSTSPSTGVDVMLARFNADAPNVQDPPVIQNQTFTTQEETALSAAVTAYDDDGDVLTFTLISPPSAGDLILNADGSFIFTPVANFVGAASFTFIANDGQSDSNVGTASITVTNVNDAPEANDDHFLASANRELVVFPRGVLLNDIDRDSFEQAVLISTTTHGALVLDSTGGFTYTPVTGFVGVDSFQYYATDGQYNSETVTVTIEVVNDPPVTSDPTFTLPEDSNQLGWVAATDANGDVLQFSPGEGPEHGTLDWLSPTTFRYTPHGNFNGSDSFTFRVSDGVSETTGVVTLIIMPHFDFPTAVSDSYSTLHDKPLVVEAPGVLANDSDIDGAALTAQLRLQAVHGVVSMNPDGSFVYTPDAGFAGLDEFSYYVIDPTDPAGVYRYTTVFIDVTNAVPLAHHASVSLAEDSSVSGQVTASDADDDSISFAALIQPEHGSLLFNVDGSFTYTPAPDFYGSDSFSFRAHDGFAYSQPAVISVQVMPVQDAPQAADDALQLRQDSTLVIDPAVLANDIDVDGDPLSLIIATQPTHGSLSLSGGQIVYTPQVGYYGPDSFTYQASDGLATSNLATVTIEVVEFGAPSGLTATLSNSVVFLSWMDNGHGYTDGFIIERAAKPKNKNTAPVFQQIGGTTSLTFREPGLGAGTWWYRVKAFDGSYFSSYSTIAELTIGGSGGGKGRQSKTSSSLTTTISGEDALLTSAMEDEWATQTSGTTGGTLDSDLTVDLLSLVQSGLTLEVTSKKK